MQRLKVKFQVKNKCVGHGETPNRNEELVNKQGNFFFSFFRFSLSRLNSYFQTESVKSPLEKVLSKLKQTEYGIIYKWSPFQYFICRNKGMISLTARFGFIFPDSSVLSSSNLSFQDTSPPHSQAHELFHLPIFVNSPLLFTCRIQAQLLPVHRI